MKDQAQILVLLARYRQKLKKIQPVMDDYDGGMSAVYTMVIRDLESVVNMGECLPPKE